MNKDLNILWNLLGLILVVSLLCVLFEMKRGQVATAMGLVLVFGIAKIIKANNKDSND